MTSLAMHRLSITSDQDDYQREVGKIRDWHIGTEDHGVFAFGINFDFGGSGQGTGMIGLGNEKHGYLTVQFLDRLCALLGPVQEWNGRQCLVLRKESYGRILGLESMPNARDRKQIIFRDLWDESNPSPTERTEHVDDQ